MSYDHTTVMLRETLHWLAPRTGGVYADTTLGGGGHAEAILDASGPEGRVIGIDRDEEALEAARARLSRFGQRATLVHGEMGDLQRILRAEGAMPVQGLVADVGVSSHQLNQADRGFSFTHDGPVDMRMDRTKGVTARELIETLSESDLANIVFTYGEERRSRRVARSLKDALAHNELNTTLELRRAVIRAVGPRRTKTDPSTRTFQALRIAVNDELGQLKGLLDALPEVLDIGARATLLTFHSLEDRLVKRALRENAHLEVLTRKPLRAGEDELRDNPRARSAKLRVAQRLREAAA